MSFAMLMQQISIILLEVALGFMGAKLGIITDRDSKFLSNLVMTMLMPCTILSCAASENGQAAARQLLLALGIMFCLFVVSVVVCGIISRLLRLPRGKAAVLAGAAAMPNCGFVGMPIAIAILGREMGTLVGTASMSAYNLLFFTYINSLFQKEPSRNLRGMITPCNVATLVMLLMLTLNIRLPEPVRSVCSAVGGCTTPVALIVVGVMLSQSELLSLVKNPFLYMISILRGLIFPLCFMLVLRQLHLGHELALGLAILASPPAGSMCAILAKRNDVEVELCGQAVAQSTLFMLLTLPLMLTLAVGWF